MLAHEQLLQHVKTKHKSPNVPEGRSCMEIPTAQRLGHNCSTWGVWGLYYGSVFSSQLFPKKPISPQFCASSPNSATKPKQSKHSSPCMLLAKPQGFLQNYVPWVAWEGAADPLPLRKVGLGAGEIRCAWCSAPHSSPWKPFRNFAATNSKRREEQWLLLRSSRRSSSSI